MQSHGVPLRCVHIKERRYYHEKREQYEKCTGRLYFASKEDGWFRWVELVGGQVMFRTVYIPSKEDDE